MRIEPPISLRAAIKHLPSGRVTAADAIRLGLVTEEEAEAVGGLSVPTADEAGAPTLAIHAAREALASSGISADAVDLLVHAWIYHQGHDFWSPAHYIAREVGAIDALALGVQQMCNGGAAALELAAARMLADPAVNTAVITTSDAFTDPGFDRWQGDYGIWYGDAGTAVVLDRDVSASTTHLLRSITSRTVLEGEGLHHGTDAFTHAARQRGRIDVRRTKKAHLTKHGVRTFLDAIQEALRAVVTQCADDIGIPTTSDRITIIALPRVGATVIRDTYLPALEGLTNANIICLGPETGHLGAGDTPANIADLMNDEQLSPGDLAFFICAGGGFTVSCVAIEKR